MHGWTHRNVTPGDLWYYTLYAKNRQRFPSVPIKWQGRAVGCPVLPTTQVPEFIATSHTPQILPLPAAYLQEAAATITMRFPKYPSQLSNWTGYDIDSAMKYNIYHRDQWANETASGEFSLVGTVYFDNFTAANDTVYFTHTGLGMGTYNGYKIALANSLCEGPVQTVDKVLRTSYDLPLPLASDPYVSSASSLPEIIVNWNASEHSTKYRLHLTKVYVNHVNVDPEVDDDEEFLMALHHNNATNTTVVGS
jgi:hypothetical protein